MNKKANQMRLKFANGTTLICSLEHRFFKKGYEGWVCVEDLSEGDYIDLNAYEP